MSDLSFAAAPFLDSYVAAFEAFDPARIAGFYHAPCLTVRGDGEVMTFASRAEIRDFFVTVIETYRAVGMVSFAFDDVETESLGDAAVTLTCRWRMLGDDASTLRTWRQTYVVGRSDGDWVILSSVFHQ